MHRDLKPSNILLTADGTPKITDFGLARRLDAGAGLSMTAMRIGTPGYMAPEQVAAHARVSGAATDVYGLGAILYEMLTGRPPFLAETAAETERQVVAEEAAPPSHLNIRVPRNLETICLKCLRKEPRRRYVSSAELEADLGRFLRGEPIAARPVGRIERAGKWIRRHPTRALSVVVSLVISVAMLVGGWWLISAQSLVTHAIEEDLRVAKQKLRRSDWDEARSILERARGRLGPGESGELRRRLDRADQVLELVSRLAKIRINRLFRSNEGPAGQVPSFEEAFRSLATYNLRGGFGHWSRKYEEVFRTSGLLEMDGSPRVAADRLGRSDVKDALLAAIDDWALCATYVAELRGDNWQLDARRETWLLEVARKADPDPRGWSDRLREPSVRRDKEELARLAGSARFDEVPINLLVSLGEMWAAKGGDPVPFLLSVQRHHPDDIWVNTLLGCFALRRNGNAEALRTFQAALAIRPGTPFLYFNLGTMLKREGRTSEAASYYRKAVEFAPRDIIMRAELGDCLVSLGKLAEAAEEFEKGLELTNGPTDQFDIGFPVLYVGPMRAKLRKGLRGCRSQSGDFETLEALWRRSMKLEPHEHDDWDGYAEFRLFRGRPDEYLSTCRGLLEHFGATEDIQVAERTGRACLLSPASGERLSVGSALIDRALASEKPKPAWTVPYLMFAKGLAEYRNGRPESSIAIMDGPARTALQSAPRLVSAMARHRLGREEEALRTFSMAILSSDWRKSQAVDREHWIYHLLRREAEAMMLPNLRGFLEGSYRPRSNDEKLCLLGVCQFEGRYEKAAEIFAEVLATNAHLADDLNPKALFRAACIAAALGAGRGHDAVGLDEAGRLRWRNQARAWLRADLVLITKLSISDPVMWRGYMKTVLKNWSSDPDLRGLQDPDACKGLLPSEQKDFRTLCEELEILINRGKN